MNVIFGWICRIWTKSSGAKRRYVSLNGGHDMHDTSMFGYYESQIIGVAERESSKTAKKHWNFITNHKHEALVLATYTQNDEASHIDLDQWSFYSLTLLASSSHLSISFDSLCESSYLFFVQIRICCKVGDNELWDQYNMSEKGFAYRYEIMKEVKQGLNGNDVTCIPVNFKNECIVPPQFEIYSIHSEPISKSF